MGRGQRGSKGQLCANKVELGPGMQYGAAEQQERWQDWRENLWQTEITALSNPGNTRDGEEGQEGKQKPENDMPVTRPLSASEHLVHWDRCPHLGWNAVILYPSPTSTQCHANTGYCSNPSAEVSERFLLRRNWIKYGRCAFPRK